MDTKRLKELAGLAEAQIDYHAGMRAYQNIQDLMVDLEDEVIGMEEGDRRVGMRALNDAITALNPVKQLLQKYQKTVRF